VDDKSRIVSEPPIKLTPPDINGMNPRRAALKQAIGKATRR